MERRRFLIGLGGLAAVGAVPAVLLAQRDEPSAAASAAAPDPGRVTAKVATRDLVETFDASGTLGYGDSRPLSLGGGGIVTALPAVGVVVDRGGQLAEVDGQPVSLLLGDRPLWRALGEGVGDGPDVEQLEANLIALGHGTEGALGPNQVWSAATTAAVKRWQRDLGVEQTGAIEPGRVVFAPAAVRISKHLAEVGAQAGAPVLEVTGTTKGIHLDLAAKRESYVHTGDAVDVVLPTGTTVKATITAVGTVAQTPANGQGDPTIPVEVSLVDPAASGDLDEAPVTVKVASTAARGVLAVPVSALLALAEGGYALEKVTGSTTTALVAVTLGASAEGWIEVKGEVAAGDEVVTAQ